tara:strand:+ start:159 stop:710 length:552 start_codon:yes stop_codon:yes gene_type:complete
VGKNTTKKWKDKKAGIYSDKKQERIDEKKAKKMARLQKRADRGNVRSMEKLQRIRDNETLQNLQNQPGVSDAEIRQQEALLDEGVGAAVQGALANVDTSAEDFGSDDLGAIVGGMAEPKAAATASAIKTKLQLKAMKEAELRNALERKHKQAGDNALAWASVIGQTAGQASGGLAGGMAAGAA